MKNNINSNSDFQNFEPHVIKQTEGIKGGYIIITDNSIG